MILDAQCLLMDSVAIASATTTDSTGFDTLLATREIEAGEAVAVVINIEATAGTGGGETYRFDLCQSANADLSSDDTLYSTNTTFLASTSLTSGLRFALFFPQGLITKRYIGLSVVTATGSPTLTLSAYLVVGSATAQGVQHANNYSIIN